VRGRKACAHLDVAVNIPPLDLVVLGSQVLERFVRLARIALPGGRILCGDLLEPGLSTVAADALLAI